MTRLLILLLLLAAPRASAPAIPASPMGVDSRNLERTPAAPSVPVVTLSSPANGKRAASVEAQPAAKPPAALRGRASWVRASLGAGYMAARMPRGTRLRVCGPLACFTGVVTDYGPSKRLHPDRIVDLSRARFAKVCGDPETLGTCAVRVWVVDVRLPETDTEG